MREREDRELTLTVGSSWVAAESGETTGRAVSRLGGVKDDAEAV